MDLNVRSTNLDFQILNIFHHYTMDSHFYSATSDDDGEQESTYNNASCNDQLEEIFQHRTTSVSRYFTLIDSIAILVVISFIIGSLTHPIHLPTKTFRPDLETSRHKKGGTRAFVPECAHILDWLHMTIYLLTNATIVSREITTFELNKSFADNPSEEVTAAWVSLIPST